MHKIAGFEAESLAGKAKTLVALKRYTEAIDLYRKVISVAEPKEHIRVHCDACSGLAEAYVGAGDLQHAVESYNRFIEINGTLNSQERIRAIAEVQARIEIEKADRERERLKKIAQELEAESETRAKELTRLALQIVEKNEFLANLREDIRSVTKSSADAKSLVNRINEHIQNDQDWENFEQQFKRVHSEFLRKLSEQFPVLTPTEMKICALMKLNLSSKAIANLFCLSTRTVENHRQSIRKKLGLTGDENLVSFLTSI